MAFARRGQIVGADVPSPNNHRPVRGEIALNFGQRKTVCVRKPESQQFKSGGNRGGHRTTDSDNSNADTPAGKVIAQHVLTPIT